MSPVKSSTVLPKLMETRYNRWIAAEKQKHCMDEDYIGQNQARGQNQIHDQDQSPQLDVMDDLEQYLDSSMDQDQDVEDVNVQEMSPLPDEPPETEEKSKEEPLAPRSSEESSPDECEYDPKPTMFQCPHCPQNFQRKSLHRQHVQQNFAEGGLSCDKCTKKFFYKCGFDLHVKSYEDKGAFKCKIGSCCHAQKSIELLQSHNASRHFLELGLPRFRCEICNELFGTKARLTVHNIRKHINARTFVCPKVGCPKRFNTKGHLENHMKACHPGERKSSH